MGEKTIWEREKKFIEKSIEFHGNKYDYSKVDYKNAHTKVEIVCKGHGSFWQRPDDHKRGNGCPKCYFESKELMSSDKVLEQFKKIHGDKYDYSKVQYKGTSNKIIIICMEHGPFEQIPSSHKRGIGCPKCYFESKELIPLNKVLEGFKGVHGDKYDYSSVDYNGTKTKVEIICNEHGSFWQRPNDHKMGNGCPKCTKLPLEKVIEKFKEIHGSRYDYSKVDYKGTATKVEIICNEHGSFWQKPNDHNNGSGCPRCQESKGEKKIREYLESKNIKFIQEYSLTISHDDVDYNHRFDFFLPDLGIHIEFDGRQHFKPIEFFGGKEAFEIIKFKDNLKNLFCENNNLRMIRIPYWDIDNIEGILIGFHI